MFWSECCTAAWRLEQLARKKPAVWSVPCGNGFSAAWPGECCVSVIVDYTTGIDHIETGHYGSIRGMDTAAMANAQHLISLVVTAVQITMLATGHSATRAVTVGSIYSVELQLPPGQQVVAESQADSGSHIQPIRCGIPRGKLQSKKRADRIAHDSRWFAATRVREFSLRCSSVVVAGHAAESFPALNA